MYKKTLLSLLLVASIALSPVAEAKGAVSVVSSVINHVVSVVLAPVNATLNFIGLGGLVGPVDCAVQLITSANIGSCNSSGGGIAPVSVGTSAPSVPQNVKITNYTGINSDGTKQYINHGFEITWDAPASFGGASSVGYKIYRGTSSTSLPTLITTTEMNNGQTLFLENRIQDPANPFYYKVVAFNSVGDSPASAVVRAPTDIQYLTEPLTLVGNGFNTTDPTATKVELINDGNTVLCSGGIVKDPQTITGAVCNITSAPTGKWTVKIISPDQKYSQCDNCFTISLPEPVSPAIVVSKTDLSDGIFKIDSVAGDNLYTGAAVKVVASGHAYTCFSLSDFNYSTNKFSGGECNIQDFLKTLGFTKDSDIGQLSVQIANDLDSIPVTPSGIPSFTCISSSYSPDPSTVCGTAPIAQYSNCGVVRSVMPALVCSSDQVCTNGACIGCTKKTTQEACGTWVCGNVSDGCGGTVSCGTCSSGYSCSGGACVSISN